MPCNHDQTTSLWRGLSQNPCPRIVWARMIACTGPRTKPKTNRCHDRNVCDALRRMSRTVARVQQILHQWPSCRTQKQTHTDGKWRRHLLSHPRGCAEHASQHDEHLQRQQFLSLCSSFTRDESSSDELVSVIFQSHPKSEYWHTHCSVGVTTSTPTVSVSA